MNTEGIYFKMILETERLILRKWTQDDAESLFTYAKNPKVGQLPDGLLTRISNQVNMLLTIFSPEQNAMQSVKKRIMLQ